jgi:addiction module RelB/DinJ family antitoxin
LGCTVAYKLFPGNNTDQTTLRPALEKSIEKMGFGKVIIVADGGLNNEPNIAHILSKGETANLSIRMDKGLKDQADSLFSELRMNMTTALNVFARQAVWQGKIPFEIGLNKPNAETFTARG